MTRFLVSLILVALAAPLAAQAKKIDFKRQIWPILEKKCVECHQAPQMDATTGRIKKPKGKVRFDSKDEFIKSKRGGLVKPGKPADSILFEVISLPADDEDVMPPPKQKTPISKKELELIKQWIEEGGDFGKWTGTEAAGRGTGTGTGSGTGATRKPTTGGSKKTQKSNGPDPLETLAKGLRPVAAEVLAGFDKSSFRVKPVGDDSPLLAVTCYGETDAVDDGALEELLPIAEHIAELNLGDSQITDAGCRTIAKMKRLVALDLRRTTVGNHGVADLIGCAELRALNLYGTKVGDYGITALSKLGHLEELYVWQTEVTDSAIARVKESIPGLRVVATAELPAPMENSGSTRRRRR